MPALSPFPPPQVPEDDAQLLQRVIRGQADARDVRRCQDLVLYEKKHFLWGMEGRPGVWPASGQSVNYSGVNLWKATPLKQHIFFIWQHVLFFCVLFLLFEDWQFAAILHCKVPWCIFFLLASLDGIFPLQGWIVIRESVKLEGTPSHPGWQICGKLCN